MCINVDYSLLKSQTVSPNVFNRTKDGMKQSWREKIRGNNAFLLTLLTLNWIHLFKVARQYLLPMWSFYCNWLSLVVRGFVPSNRVWNFFQGSWCKKCAEICNLLVIFLIYLLLEHQRKTNTAAFWWDQKLARVSTTGKIKYETKWVLGCLRWETD